MENKPEGSPPSPERQSPKNQPPEHRPSGNMPPDGRDDSDTPRPRFSPVSIAIFVILAVMLMMMFYNSGDGGRSQVDYGLFMEELKKDPTNITEVDMKSNEIFGKFKEAPEDPDGKPDEDGKLPKFKEEFITVVPLAALQDGKLNELLVTKLGAKYSGSQPPDSTLFVLMFYLAVTVGLIAVVWFMFRRTREQLLGGGALAGFNKSPAKRYESGDKPITFDDVAGLTGVKNELEEIVDFLKNPERFQRLGGRVPKGVLLMGPPPEPVKRCWAARSPARRACRFSRSTAPSLYRCSWAWAPAASAICSARPKPPRRRSSSLTRSTPSDATAARAWAADTTNANKRSTRSLARWTASRKPNR